LAPEKQSVDVVLNEMHQLQADIKSIEEIARGEKISWARKLNIISDSLPKSVWLKRVALGDGVFFIEGSALSRTNSEMTGVHKLTSSLRESQDFLKGLEGLEITSIQSRSMSGTDVVDFLITVKVAVKSK
jgi:DNA-binding protein